MKKTFVEYTTHFSKMPEYRFYMPDRADSVFLILEHEEGATDEFLLEEMFALCNHGSGREHPQFLAAKMPSLSVSDIVSLGQKEEKRTYVCTSFGWKRVQNKIDNPQ